MGEWSEQFAQWAKRPVAQLLSALIFLVFLVLSVTLGQLDARGDLGRVSYWERF
jgi:hypothetical protein